MSDLEMILVPRSQVERVVEIANRNEWSLDGDALARRLSGEDWIVHDGGGLPVAGETHVEVRFRDGTIDATDDAGFWNARPSWWKWAKDSTSIFDIIAYRVRP